MPRAFCSAVCLGEEYLGTSGSFKVAAGSLSVAYYDTQASWYLKPVLRRYPGLHLQSPPRSTIVGSPQPIASQHLTDQTSPRSQSSHNLIANMSYDCNCCLRRFYSQHAQWQHKVEKNHFDYECSCCYQTYDTEHLRKEHEVEYHHYCAECERQFVNHNNIQQHLRSAAHLAGSITCPFCKRGFTTATGLVHHIESSACPNAKGLDRDAVYRIVRQKDPSGVISKKLIGWTGSESYQATDRAWNPYEGAYECYFCTRTFGKLSSLNQHLQSPARALIGSAIT